MQFLYYLIFKVIRHHAIKINIILCLYFFCLFQINSCSKFHASSIEQISNTPNNNISDIKLKVVPFPKSALNSKILIEVMIDCDKKINKFTTQIINCWGSLIENGIIFFNFSFQDLCIDNMANFKILSSEACNKNEIYNLNMACLNLTTNDILSISPGLDDSYILCQ